MKPYLTIPQALPRELCELALKDFRQGEFERGQIYNDDGALVVQEDRTGTVRHIADGHWLEPLLGTLGQTANNIAGYGFNITGSQPIQVANYEAGQKYDWHYDTSLIVPAGQITRKLTVVLQLTHEDSFTGGGLFVENVEKSVLSKQGDVAVLPSFVKHKAETVTSGTRTTAVIWLTGPAFT
jgi:predicted 2-oxoglutarate/Fe(II)-dependent dioxygenase YbiX